MAGIGEASAILGTIQIGFSLAKALNTYVGDYQAANDDIVSLAADIDATFTHVKALEDLVKANKLVRSLDDGGAKLAQKCKEDSDRILKKLIKILTKAGVPNDFSRAVEPGDINPSQLTRFTWPFLRPQVEFVKRELDSTRIEILLARSCIEARSATVYADRSAARATIPGLARRLAHSEMRAEKKLKEARAKTALPPQQGRSSRGALGSDDEQNIQPNRIPSGICKNKQNSYDSRNSNRSGRYGASHGRYDAGQYYRRDAGRYDQAREDEIMAQRLREQIETEIILRKLDEEYKAEGEKKLQDDAVEAFKKSLLDQYATRVRGREMEEARLKQSFQGILTEQQIHKYVENQPIQGTDTDLVEMLSKLQRTEAAPSIQQRSSRSSSVFTAMLPRSLRSPSHAAILPTAPDGSKPVPETKEYIHVLISKNEGCILLDGTTFTHDPCKNYCDLAKSMAIWAEIDDEWKWRARRCAPCGSSSLRLHSAWHADAPRSSTMRRIINRALLGRELGARLARDVSWSYVMVVFVVIRPVTEKQDRIGDIELHYTDPSLAEQPDFEIDPYSCAKSRKGPSVKSTAWPRSCAKADNACSKKSSYFPPPPPPPVYGEKDINIYAPYKPDDWVRNTEESDDTDSSSSSSNDVDEDDDDDDDDDETYSRRRPTPRSRAAYKPRSTRKGSKDQSHARQRDKHVRFASARREPQWRGSRDERDYRRSSREDSYEWRRQKGPELSPNESVSQAGISHGLKRRDYYGEELVRDLYRSASPTEIDHDSEPETSTALNLDDDALSHWMLVKYTGGALPLSTGLEEATENKLGDDA